MNTANLETAREAVEQARSAVSAAVQVLAGHEAAWATYPGHCEAADSLGRALTETSEAHTAIVSTQQPRHAEQLDTY